MSEQALRRRRILVWLASLAVVATVVAAGSLVYTGRPSFCGGCHIMQTRYVSWARSDHVARADCLDCHADPGTLGEIRAHLSGLRYLTILVTGRPQPVLRAQVPDDRCIECHDVEDVMDTVDGVRLAHTTHFGNGVGCVVCHRGFHDSLTGGTLRADLGNCTECHPQTVLRRTP